MRRPVIVFAATVALLMAGAQAASAERLVVSLSSHRVLINSSFTGAELILFGAVEPDEAGAAAGHPRYDVVVTVAGPPHSVVTRRKERVLGIWVNVESRTFVDAPSYLAVLSNQPLDAIASADVRRRLQIGIGDTVISGDAAGIANNDEFRAAFIRLNRNRGLYREDREEANAVTFLTPSLFRAAIQLPANVPIGVYKVDVKLFAKGAMIAPQTSYLEVVKVGFEQYVANAARDYGLLYGLATSLLALITGWLASVVFRRD